MGVRIGVGTLLLSLGVLILVICVVLPETEAGWGGFGGGWGGGWGGDYDRWGSGCVKPGLFCRGAKSCCRGYVCRQGRCMIRQRGGGFGFGNYYDYQDDYYDYIL